MIRPKVGDAVRVSRRAVSPTDAKSGLFFDYYRGLQGTVQKVFEDGETAIRVEPESLPEEVWRRHISIRDRMRDAWLKSLSDEARRKLTPDQKRFDLSYVILVSTSDLERDKRRAPV